MSTTVPKITCHSIKVSETDFNINNRGSVIVAKSFQFNSNNNTVALNLSDDSTKFGILDGSHTYTTIIDNRNNLPEPIDKFVKLEIIVGKELFVSHIADVQNISTSVSGIALYKLDDKFDFTKEASKNETYSNDIVFKDIKKFG